VQKFVGGPGLGSADSVRFYDSSDNLIFTFSYALNGFILSNGSGALGGHAGLSAGGTAQQQSAVIDPVFGTGAGRRYTAAIVGIPTGSRSPTQALQRRTSPVGKWTTPAQASPMRSR
jgi:hypothetical protein